MTHTYRYRKVSGRHTVGYFTRRRTWRQESVHLSAAFAADRAVYLNGGTTEWSARSCGALAARAL